MKPSLQLRLGQHLAMTPQLQQAIRLLQLSTLELHLEIAQALESNPLLDVAEEQDEETSAEPEAEASTETSDEDLDLESVSPDQDVIPEDLPLDAGWDDIYEGSGGSSEEYSLEARNSAPLTLRQHLLEQLNLVPLSPKDHVIALAIIDAVNDAGYLAASLEELQEGLGPDVDTDDIEVVLRLVQSFSPSGVAARDLRECLLIQLHQLDQNSPWQQPAIEVVTHHMELLARHDYDQLAREISVTPEDLENVVRLVRSLNPRPGNFVDATPAPHITPDVFVRQRRGQWQVELNPEALPRLRLNPFYVGLMRRSRRDDDQRYLKNQLQEARWLLKSLRSRNQTLLRVARCIVERQTAFLERGPEAMRPMVLHDVAEELGMHESTVSRVTMQKYIHTPRGVFELKYFFSSHVSTADGGTCSATALRARIKKMIASEDPGSPLSDSRIAAILGEEGIQVARRTVAKYREVMAIPSARERRHLA